MDAAKRTLDLAGTKGGRSLWECRCDCGNIIMARADALKSQHTSSCGCRNPFGTFRHKDHPDRENGNIRKAISQYRTGARVRGYEWGLTDDEAMSMFSQSCYYCGAPQ